MSKETDAGCGAVGAPVQRRVRPLVERLEDAAHAWEHSLTICGDYMPSPAMLREAKAEIELLQQETFAVRRYCADVQQEGTANERIVAQVVSRMLARPNAA